MVVQMVINYLVPLALQLLLQDAIMDQLTAIHVLKAIIYQRLLFALQKHIVSTQHLQLAINAILAISGMVLLVLSHAK